MQSNLNYMKILNEDVDSIIAENLPWSDLKDKKILITGANGFIASYIVNVLMKLNDRYNLNILVIALVRNYEKAQKRFYHLLNRKDLTYLIQDVSEPIDVEADIIIHAASPANAKEIVDNMSVTINTFNANIIGLNNIINLSIKNNATLLVLGSGAIYGDLVDVPLLYEDMIDRVKFNVYTPKNYYSLSKVMGEIISINYRKMYNLNLKIARLFSVYGPGDDMYAGRCFNDFIIDILNNRTIKLKGSGLNIRTFCYVSDAVSGLFTILLKGHNTEYNVGNEYNLLSLKDLAYECSEFLTNEVNPKVYIGNNDVEQNILVQQSIVPSINKLLRLGWEPKISIKDCIQRVLNSLN